MAFIRSQRIHVDYFLFLFLPIQIKVNMFIKLLSSDCNKQWQCCKDNFPLWFMFIIHIIYILQRQWNDLYRSIECIAWFAFGVACEWVTISFGRCAFLTFLCIKDVLHSVAIAGLLYHYWTLLNVIKHTAWQR